MVRHWPDVSQTLIYTPTPLSKLIVEFKKGRVWEIDCNAKRSTGADLDKSISDLFREYGDDIVHVDLGLIPKLKRDIEKRNLFFQTPLKRRSK